MVPLEAEVAPTKKTREEVLLLTLHGAGVMAALLICFAAYWLGMIYNVLVLLPLVSVSIMILARSWSLYQRSLEWQFLRHPLKKVFRRYLLQALNQWVFWILLLPALHLAVIPAQFKSADYLVIGGSVGVLLVLSFIPHKKIRVSTNIFFAVGWLFLWIEMFRIFLPPSPSERVVLDPPFSGEWYIFHGGRSALINHHFPLSSQRHALDIGKTIDVPKGQGHKLSLDSFASYGDTLYAPADGKVVKVVNDRPDMEIGQTDLWQIVGNQVVVDIGQERFILMAHLMKGSVRVLPGETVKRRQPIARCGNSGNTSQPHLHLQAQSHSDFKTPGLKTFPILFRNAVRVHGGKRKQFTETDVRRNDILIVPK